MPVDGNLTAKKFNRASDVLSGSPFPLLDNCCGIFQARRSLKGVRMVQIKVYAGESKGIADQTLPLAGADLRSLFVQDIGR